MYLDFFKLKELPFRLAADQKYYFLGSAQESAKSRLRAALAEADGCLMLGGKAGVGKTMLLQDLSNELPAHYNVAHIRNPEVSLNEFYQAVLAQVDERPPVTAGTAVRANFDTCLARLAAMRHTLVLMVDNGELMSRELQSELLRLPRKSGTGTRNLRIVVSTSSAMDKLANGDPSFSALGLALRVGLSPLEEDETREYVEHRMKIASAGLPAPVFQPDAFPELQRYSGGVPRLINILADTALMLAFNRNRNLVGASDVRSATDQLKWVEFKSRADDELDVSLSTGRHRLIGTPDEALSVPRAGRLRIEHDGATIEEFDLPIGKVSMGRAVGNDVRIDSQFVSRHHCHILTTAQYSVIEDLQSQNGIIVGKRRVSVHRLQDGDRVNLGEHILAYSVLPKGATPRVASFPLVLAHKSTAHEPAATRVLHPEPEPSCAPGDSASRG